MKTNYNRRKFLKISSAAATGSAAVFSGFNYSFAASSADYSPYHRSDLQDVPVINMHTHVRDMEQNATIEGLDAEVKNRLVVMDKMNIQKVIILMSGKEMGRISSHYLKKAPDRFIVYTGLDFSTKNEPGWSENMVRLIDENVRSGARGLKMIIGKPLVQASCMAMDDPRLDPVYDRAGELGLPIAYHSNDPEDFFYPPNQFNYWRRDWQEKDTHVGPLPRTTFYKALNHKPVTREQLIIQQENMISKHPNTTFILVHMAFLSRQLALLADILDRHPNVLLDLSAEVGEMGRCHKESAQFLTYYADRVLFGTDGSSQTDWEPFLHRHFICLESDIDELDTPYQRAWKIHGMNLSKEVLEKIYYKNARELLARPVKIPQKR